MMSEIYTALNGPYWDAEMAYRRELAQRSLRPRAAGRRRLKVRRRRGLRAPAPAPRPATV